MLCSRSSMFVSIVICASNMMVSSVYVPKAFSTPSPQCVRKCARCPPTPNCAPGVSLVKDDCGCCKTCARQMGETCNERMKCDSHKNLYCSFGDFDQSEGRCVAKPGRSCFSNGNTILNGESFNIGCKVTCTCIDGYLGCLPLCPITIAAHEPKNCLHPRLVSKPNRCCKEWMCAGSTRNNTTIDYSRPTAIQQTKRILAQPTENEPHFAAAYRKNPIAITVRAKDKCKIQTSEWSACSTTCGWGVSERVTTDNKRCKLRKQTRLCQLRPCEKDFAADIKRGKRCAKTVKAQRRVRYTYSGCRSKAYAPKYCGTCTDGRCCSPKHTTTKAIKFTCDDGSKFKKRIMNIKSCKCVRGCLATENDIFSSHRVMNGDTWH